MPKVTFKPSGKICQVKWGTTVLQASNDFHVGLSSCCGGRAICTTCRVIVVEGMDALSPIEDYESDMLELLRIDPFYRLGCQSRVYGNVVVEVP